PALLVDGQSRAQHCGRQADVWKAHIVEERPAKNARCGGTPPKILISAIITRLDYWTANCTEVVRVAALPEVALMVTVYVPAGVPVVRAGLLKREQRGSKAIAPRTISSKAPRNQRRRRESPPTSASPPMGSHIA